MFKHEQFDVVQCAITLVVIICLIAMFGRELANGRASERASEQSTERKLVCEWNKEHTLILDYYYSTLVNDGLQLRAYVCVLLSVFFFRRRRRR